jgi:Acetyltransferase (GNAT) domain
MNVIINQTDLKRLSDFEKPTLFIANKSKRKKEDKALKSFLGNKYPNIVDISFNVDKPKKSIGNIEQVIENTTVTKPVFILSVAFPSDEFDDLSYQKKLNTCFKSLKKMNMDMVLISIMPNKLIDTDRPTETIEKPKKNTLQIRISPKIESSDIGSLKKGYEVRRFVQSRLFAMDAINATKTIHSKIVETNSNQAIIAKPTESELILSEIDLLRHWGFRVVEQSNFEVFVSDSNLIPNTLREIGRLREITFRAVGEGTGNEIDIDDFDLYYKQLIIWDKAQSRIVGGYRIGLGNRIFAQYGINGFYISTLFKIKEGLLKTLTKSIELGRSYIIEDYQRKPQPLFLLWKGILMFLLANPNYRYLIGPVSISRKYSDISRSMMVAFLKKYHFNLKLSKHLKPRKAFKVKSKGIDTDILLKTLGNEIGNLDKFIESTEESISRTPVLLRQYIRQNAKFIGFNIDPLFADCLDGLIVVDIKDIPKSTIESLQKERLAK